MEDWSIKGIDSNLVKNLMTNFSLLVRKEQFKIFKQLLDPKPYKNVLDIGVTPSENLKDNNYFEKVYPYRQKLTIASIEDCRSLVNKFGLKKFILIKPNVKLPFKDNEFDIVTAWATLEHVGSRKKQRFFLSELARVGKKVFITTPDKYSIYEPHTTLFFLHWLRPIFFRKVVRMLGKDFWADEKNLNILSFNEAQKIAPKSLKIKKYKLFRVLPSHLIFWS